MALNVDDITIETTKAGFLVDSDQWNEQIADLIARAHGIELTAMHWSIIKLLRDYCINKRNPPSMRIFSKLIKDNIGAEQARSIYLMQLLGSSPAAMAAKIAGLPKPKNCL